MSPEWILDFRQIAKARIQRLGGKIKSSGRLTGKPDRTRYSSYRELSAGKELDIFN
jgi:copper oxidase (laccase) domain-containing protein